MSSAIAVETGPDSRIIRVVLNRPPANALDLGTIEALYETFRTLAQDRNVQVIAVESALPRIFSAGADVSTVEAHDVDLMDRLGQAFKDLFLHMRHMPQIIVAAVGGHCLGGGLELALAADFRLAKQGAGQVGLPEINLGLFPGGGGVQMAARLVGIQRAYRMALTGTLTPIDEAYAWGLFDELVPAEQFPTRVGAFLQEVAERPGQAVRALKAAVWRGMEMNLAGAFDFERMMHRDLVATEDAREGVRAFREKRAPVFRGR
jgi:enoyl-CoA hydratase/carnithine racemase